MPQRKRLSDVIEVPQGTRKRLRLSEIIGPAAPTGQTTKPIVAPPVKPQADPLAQFRTGVGSLQVNTDPQSIYAPRNVELPPLEQRGQLQPVERTATVPPAPQAPAQTPREVLQPWQPVGEAIVDTARSLATPENAAAIAAGILSPPVGIAAGLYFLPKMLEAGADAYGLELAAEADLKRALTAGDIQAAQKAQDAATYFKTQRYLMSTGVAAGGYGMAKYGSNRINALGQREASGLPAVSRQEAPPATTTPIVTPSTPAIEAGVSPSVALQTTPRTMPGGRVTAEILPQQVRVGYPPQRTALGTGIAGELPPANIPQRRGLPPAPTVELPAGGVVRPPEGQPGGIPPRSEQTVTPTPRGITPRTRVAPGDVQALQRQLNIAKGQDVAYAGRVNTRMEKLKGKKPTAELQQIVREQQANRQTIKDLESRIAAAEGRTPKRKRLSEVMGQPTPATPPTPVGPGELLPQQVQPLTFAQGAAAPTLGQTPQEAATLLGRGRRPELLKEGKQFDQERLVGSELFQGRGGPQQFLGTDPRAPQAEIPASPYAQAVDETARLRLQSFLTEVDTSTTPKSLVEFLREKGGLLDEGGDLASREVDKGLKPFQRRLIQKQSGLPLDTARELAAESGYLPKDTPATALLDLIDQEARGKPVYSIEDRGTGGIKEAYPELASINEPPAKIAEAILKDGNNPLYKRVLEASREWIDRYEGEAISRAVGEDPNATLDFGPETGAARLGALRPVHNVRQAIFQGSERLGEAALQGMGAAVGNAFDKLAPERFQRTVGTAVKSALGLGEYGRSETYKGYRRELRGELAEARDQAAKFGDMLLESLPDKESRLLAGKLVRNEATPEEIAGLINDPSKYRGITGAAELVRSEFMRLAEDIVAEGVKQYSKLDEPARQAIIAAMKGQTKAEDLGPGLRHFAETGVAKYFGEYLPRLYRSKEAAKVFKKYGLHEARVRLELSRLKRRGELSPEVRKALGEIEELVEPAVRGTFEENVLLSKNRFFTKIANDSTLTAADPMKAPASWLPLPEADLLGPLAGKTVNPAVYRDLMDMVNAPNETAKVLRTLNRLVKKGKTVYSPASQVRNYFSNWITRDAVGGMDLMTQGFRDLAAFRDIVKKTERYKEARKAGLFDTDYSSVDLSQVRLDELPMAPVPGVGGAFDIVAKIMESLRSVDDAATWAYRMGDDVPKLGYYNWLRDAQKYSPADAVKRTLDVLPDYSEVPPIVEGARRSVIGPSFLTYQAIMAPRFARSILKHPLRAGKYLVIGSLIGKALLELGVRNEDEVEREEKELPNYMKPVAAIPGVNLDIGRFSPLPFKDKNGRSLYWDLTYSLPFGDVLEGSGAFGLPSVFDIGIIPGTVLDLGFNTNAYGSYLQGEPVPIWRPADSLLEKARKGTQYAGAQLLPTLTPKVGYGARRLESAFEETPSYYGDSPQSKGAAAAQVIGGFKTVAIDRKTEAEARVRELRGDLADLDGQIRSIARNQSLSREERKRQVDKLLEARQRRVDAYRSR